MVKKMSQEELLQQQVPEISRRFFGNQVMIPQQQLPQEKTGYGSAFFLSKDGYLLTDHHVVEDASKVTIVLNNRRELDATGRAISMSLVQRAQEQQNITIFENYIAIDHHPATSVVGSRYNRNHISGYINT